MEDLADVVVAGDSTTSAISQKLTTRQIDFVKLMEGVVIAHAGCELTKDNPTKDCKTKLYANCVSWVHSDRINVVLKDELEKRKHLLENWLTIEPLDEKMFYELRMLFPIYPDENAIPPEKVKKVFDFWDSLKRDCRNVYGPAYDKREKKSGIYDDSSCLIAIFESTIVTRINENQRKAYIDINTYYYVIQILILYNIYIFIYSYIYYIYIILILSLIKISDIWHVDSNYFICNIVI